jgi:hypothetical protein
MAPNPNDDALAQLEHDWPRWQIWTVRKYIGGTTWCARLRDDHKKVINADSPAHLAEALESEVSEPIDHGGWVSGSCVNACQRCGQPAPGGNDWCTACENADGAEALAALRGTGPDSEIPVMDMPMTGDLLREMYPDWTIALNETLGVWTAEQATGSEVRYLVARRAWELALKIKATLGG